ncbi:MAG: DUF697 domain-containing protein [Acidobacteriota bacterium]
MNEQVESKGRPGAMRIVHRYVGVSAVAGLITVPALDVVALGSVHVALIKELTDYYGAEFSEHTARNILIAIMAGLVPGAIGSSFGRKLLSALPFVAHGAGLLVMSGFSAGVSYALGNIFIRHFEAGGTLDSFNPENLHQIFSRPPA